MLSYQHEYHAGSVSDIFKHTALCLILESLSNKGKPFTVIDTHSSAAVFYLDDTRLLKTGDAERGIERLYALYKDNAASFPEGLRMYMETETAYLESRRYAGSAELEYVFARRRPLSHKENAVHFVELHPESLASLKENMSGRRVTIHNEDSYKTALALTPPLIKRGLLFCDPSYEDRGDFEDVRVTLEAVRARWSAGIIALWYPILDGNGEAVSLISQLEAFCREPKVKCDTAREEIRLIPRSDGGESRLTGSGMFVMNPPWKLSEELSKCARFIESVSGLL